MVVSCILVLSEHYLFRVHQPCIGYKINFKFLLMLSVTLAGTQLKECIEHLLMLGRPALQFYKVKMSLFESCADVSEIASLIGCDEDNPRIMLQAYANAKNPGNCPLTNKNVVPADLLPLSKDSIVARVTPWSD